MQESDVLSVSHPYSGRYDLTQGERIADIVVHCIGIALALAGGGALLALSWFSARPIEFAAAIVYLLSLLAVLGISCTYNALLPSPLKWVFRRADHAAIYLLIAGTYTPFITQLDDPVERSVMLLLIWGMAIIGVSMKLLLPGRFDRLAIVFYLLMGWSGIAMNSSFSAVLPTSTLMLIVAGGIVYSAGVIVYLRQDMKYQSALWHGFVVSAAVLHMGAIIDCLVISRWTPQVLPLIPSLV
ncbi:PAQR family membrane homeostasis protein TrhA [Limoniibacter endophyticus]|uniref:DNA-binding protein n=1 Tax=Limoniibacter endophyticus TaxID=1565040 RepID=A0A8J3DK89_9HYPH|nr:hemolysin III family protein [Limoniibacter endophyticus]GHC76801.1 DNA-binding protein [Limoniibacter endophyticus]